MTFLSTACQQSPNTPDASIPVGDQGTSGPADMGTAPGDQGTLSQISGTSIGVYVMASGEVRRPDDLSKVPIVALAPGPGGALTTHPITGHPDGSFTIAGVPQGPYWVRQGADRYIWTKSRTLDLDHYELGRPDVVAATQSTPVAVTLTNLQSWLDNDDLQLSVPNVNLSDSLLSYSDIVPNDGDQMFLTSVDWLNLATPWLLDPKKGDLLYIGQLHEAVAAGQAYLSLVAAASVPSFAVQDGDSPMLSAALGAAGTQQGLPVHWMRSVFEGMRQGVNPAANSYAQDAAVNANPAGAAHGVIGKGPDLLRLQPTAGATDLDLGTLGYLNPFPQGYAIYGRFTHAYSVTYQLPSTSNKATLLGLIEVTAGVDQLGAGPIVPLVGPVQGPMLNGMNAFTSQSGVGMTPTLSWGAPAMGNLTGTQVMLYNLSVPAGSKLVKTTLVATFYTTERSLKLPPAVLTPGQTYCFQIRALSQPGLDISQAPFQDSLPRGIADVLTAAFVP